MTPHVQNQLAGAVDYYKRLDLEQAYLQFKEVFNEISDSELASQVPCISLYIRTLYELGKDQELDQLKRRFELNPHLQNQAELLYPLALSLLTRNSPQVKTAKKVFENALSLTSNADLLARNKMGLATCLDILTGDYRSYESIIRSIDTKKTDPYLSDLVAVWKAKILRDSGKVSEAEKFLGSMIAKVKPSFNWHAYLSAKIILGGVYLRQEKYDRLLSVIKEVRAYCDRHPLRTIRRQMDHLGDQIKGQENRPKLLWKKSGKTQILKYQDRVLSLTGDQPWQKLLISLISKKILPKNEIIRKLYKRSYHPQKDDKIIYGQLHLIKKHLLKLGLSQKSVTKEASGYRWNEEVSEWEGA